MEDETEEGAGPLIIGKCLCGGHFIWVYDWGWHSFCNWCGLEYKQVRLLVFLALAVPAQFVRMMEFIESASQTV